MEIDEDKEKGGWTKIYNQLFINLPCYKKDTMSKQLVIRVQSPQGNKRVTASPTESLKTFLDKVRKEFELGPTGWNCYTGRDKRKELKPLSTTLQVAGVKHGDMLYLFGPEAAKESPSSTAAFYFLPILVKIHLSPTPLIRIKGLSWGYGHPGSFFSVR